MQGPTRESEWLFGNKNIAAPSLLAFLMIQFHPASLLLARPFIHIQTIFQNLAFNSKLAGPQKTILPGYL